MTRFASYYTPLLLALLGTSFLSMPLLAAPNAKLAPLPPLEYGTGSARDLGIAAVVGGDAISSYDVENRVKFIIVTAHLSNTPDVIEKIRPQVIRSLIDEKLQLQEAGKNDIKVTQADIDQAIASIEEQRGMPSGMIYRILDDNHIPRETFTQQIRAQISWNHLLVKKIRPSVHVSDAEIAMASQRFTPPPKKKNAPGIPQELKIAVITLPVDKPKRDLEIRRLGEKLVKEVRGGANFEEVSRQFSSVAASSGGKVESFWIKLVQLDPGVAKVLANASAGTITDPIRSNEGYTIIKVYDTRAPEKKEAGAKNSAEAEEKNEDKPKDMEVSMKEILLKLKPDASAKEADAMLQIGEEVAKNPGTCDEKGLASVKNLEDFDIEVNFSQHPLSELPPAIRIIAENLKVGDISTPFASFEGIRLYMVCGKKEVDAKPVDREEVTHMLIQQKMELEAQKYIRNLRRETFIDIR